LDTGKRRFSRAEKPCELPDNYDTNCLNCSSFEDCQLREIGNRKTELSLDEDY